MDKHPVPYKKIIFVCTNQRAPSERKCCNDGGGSRLRDKLKEMVKERRLKGAVRVSQSGCLDRCEHGPNIMVFPDNLWYSHVEEDDLPQILEAVMDSLRAEGALPEGS